MMVQFLTTLILALIIFVPACYITSNIFFRTSEQAKDNYIDFVKELTNFAEKEQIGARKSILLIMDEATAIVYFEKDGQEVFVNVDAALPSIDFTVNLQKPGQCDDTKNCLCLFRSSKFETEGTEVIVTPQRVVCSNIDYRLEVETCSMGVPSEVNSYTCSNGFMIERQLTKNIPREILEVHSYYELPRRTVLYFVKFEDSVRLIGDYGEQ